MSGTTPAVVVVTETVFEAEQRRKVFANSALPGNDGAGVVTLGRFNRLLLRLAGVDLRVLATCPWEAPKYTGLGTILALVALIHGVGLSFAMGSLLDSIWIAPLIGVLWASFLLALDRWIFADRLLTHRRPLSTAVLLGLRTVSGLMTATVIASATALGVFAPEINQSIAEANASALTAARQAAQQAERVYLSELDNKTYEGLLARKTSLSGMKAAVDDTARQVQLAEEKASRPPGVHDRFAALNHLRRDSSGSAAILYVGFALAVMIELMGFLTVLASGRDGAYVNALRHYISAKMDPRQASATPAEVVTAPRSMRGAKFRRQVLAAAAAVVVIVGAGVVIAPLTDRSPSEGALGVIGLPTNSLPPPNTYTWIQGPKGLAVPTPPGWRIAQQSDRSMTLTDPARSGVRAHLGAIPAVPEDLMEMYTEYETSFADRPDYRRLTLEEVTVPAGFPGVLWEYQLTEAGTPRQTSTVYWRQNKLDYSLSVSAPVSQWPATAEIFRTMVGSAQVNKDSSPTSAVSAPPTVVVTRGNPYTGTMCSSPECSWIRVTTANFPGRVDCSFTSDLGQEGFVIDRYGPNETRDSRNFFGIAGATVTVTCGGVAGSAKW